MVSVIAVLLLVILCLWIYDRVMNEPRDTTRLGAFMTWLIGICLVSLVVEDALKTLLITVGFAAMKNGWEDFFQASGKASGGNPQK